NKTETAGQIQIDAMLHGYHSGFMFAVIITIISLLLTFLIKSKKKVKAEAELEDQ
ncbi:drug:proton antiporter, partial [Staphylococcus borealis]